MLWLDKHARFRQRLSPYLDGRLTPAQVKPLEAHLDSCDACRRELDELRTIASAVRDLPNVEAPRSFALTPHMLERRAATAVPAAPRLAVGMRLVSAAVAVALAGVLIGDLSSLGGGGDGGAARIESEDQSRTTAEFGAGAEEPAATAAANQFDLDADTDDRGLSPAPAASGEGADASCPSAATGGTATGGGVGGPGSPGATPVPTASPETSPSSAAVEAGAGCDETAVGAAAPEASAPPEDGAPREATDEDAAGEPAAAAEDDGGGISALRVLELALAGSLIALLAAVVVEFALRRKKLSQREPY